VPFTHFLHLKGLAWFSGVHYCYHKGLLMIFQYIIINGFRAECKAKNNINYKNHDRKPSQCAGVAGLLNVEPASFFAL
jgi:hypothetical protein